LDYSFQNSDVRAARGQRWEQLSALLPQVTAAPYIADSQINLAPARPVEFWLGCRFRHPWPIFPIVDARLTVTQSSSNLKVD